MYRFGNRPIRQHPLDFRRQCGISQAKADRLVLLYRDADLYRIAAQLLHIQQRKLRFVVFLFRTGRRNRRSADRYCDLAFLHLLEQLLELLFVLEFAILNARFVGGLHEVLEQRGELKLVEESPASFVVGLLCQHGREIQMHRNIGIDRHQVLAAQDDVAIVQQRLTISFALHFFCVIERVLHRTKALDQLYRTLVADSGRAGNVIDGIAAQRHHVDYLLRRNAENLFHLSGVADQVVLRRIQHADAVAHELEHVFVAGDHVHRMAGGIGLMRQRADDIVGLESRLFQNGNAICVQRAPDVRKLLRQIVRHLLAIGLVSAVSDLLVGLRLAVVLLHRCDCLRLLIAKCRRSYVEDRRKVLRVEVVAQLVQHVDEDKGSCRGNPGASRHRTLPLHGVICPEDEGHSVDQEDMWTGFGLWLRRQGLRKV